MMGVLEWIPFRYWRKTVNETELKRSESFKPLITHSMCTCNFTFQLHINLCTRLDIKCISYCALQSKGLKKCSKPLRFVLINECSSYVWTLIQPHTFEFLYTQTIVASFFILKYGEFALILQVHKLLNYDIFCLFIAIIDWYNM